jgi:hypothetical protein
MRPKPIVVAKIAAVISSLLLGTAFVVYHATGGVPWFSSTAEGNLSESPVTPGLSETTLIPAASKSYSGDTGIPFLGDEKDLVGLPEVFDTVAESIPPARTEIMSSSKSMTIVQPGVMLDPTRLQGQRSRPLVNPKLVQLHKDVSIILGTLPQVANPPVNPPIASNPRSVMMPSSKSMILSTAPQQRPAQSGTR